MPPAKYVSAAELRAYFNEGRYADLVVQGILHEKLIREAPARPGAKQPPGTRSQTLAYLNSEGRQIAKVHQYLRADGKLGGSGRPDPKILFHNGTLYFLDESQ